MSPFDTTRRIGVIRRALAFGCSIALAAGAAFAQSSGNPSRGEARAAACGSCHGSPQSPPLAGMSSLAGQQEQFLVLQLFLLREGLRDVPQMAGMLKGVTDQDFMDIAVHYARQAPPRSNGKPDSVLRARGAGLSQAMGCGSCHLQDYRGQRQVPRLSNQQEDHLAASLKAYRDNKRLGTDTNMNWIMYQATDSDIQALAHYLAHQPPP